MKSLFLLFVFVFSIHAEAYFYYDSGDYITNEFDATVVCNERIEYKDQDCEIRWGAYYTIELETVNSIKSQDIVNLDKVFIKKIIQQRYTDGYRAFLIKSHNQKLSQQQHCQHQQQSQQEFTRVWFEKSRDMADELESFSNIIDLMKDRIKGSLYSENCRLDNVRIRPHQQQQQGYQQVYP